MTMYYRIFCKYTPITIYRADKNLSTRNYKSVKNGLKLKGSGVFGKLSIVRLRWWYDPRDSMRSGRVIRDRTCTIRPSRWKMKRHPTLHIPLGSSRCDSYAGVFCLKIGPLCTKCDSEVRCRVREKSSIGKTKWERAGGDATIGFLDATFHNRVFFPNRFGLLRTENRPEKNHVNARTRASVPPTVARARAQVKIEKLRNSIKNGPEKLSEGIFGIL